MFKELVEKSKNILFTRQQAYRHIFKQGQASERVLRDLAKFCRANTTTFQMDARAHAILEGRREVWLRIQQHLEMDSQALWSLYGRTDLE